MEEDRLKKNGMHDKANPIIFKNAAQLRSNMTEPEKLLWEKLRLKPLGFKFRRQHPISTYILDFYCHKLKLSIEIDGGYHLTKEQKAKDMERTKVINDLGIKEIRFTNNDVTQTIENVMSKIHSELHAGSL
jgi:very-short-patch-repair endonuclease